MKPATQPLRILFVNRMASMVRGGGETFDLEMSRHLEKLGCETLFLSGLPLFGPARYPLNRPRSHTLRTPYTGWLPCEQIRGGWRLRLMDFKMFERRAADWAAARRVQFDVVQVCELPFFVDAWIKKRTGIPVVMRLTAPNYYDPVGAVQAADAVIASGTTIAKIRSSARPNCFDIPNAVDTEFFSPRVSGFREKNGIGHAEFVVLYVARMVDFKGHLMLLDAFAEFLGHKPSSKLVLAGSGPMEPVLTKSVRALGLDEHVLFLGQQAYEELPAVYAAADVKVISSDERESFCFAALEAMSMGLPLVATRCGMLPALLEGERGGLLVPVGDVHTFSGALLKLAGDKKMREQMGLYNRAKAVREHGWDSSAGKLLAVYRNLATQD